MDELGARLDRGRPARQALRVDAAADARPRLDDDDAQARAHQAARRLQAGDAGADDDDVGVAVSSSGHGGNMRAAPRDDNVITWP